MSDAVRHAKYPTPAEERYLADRLDIPAHQLYGGLTDPGIRRDRIRARIIALGWQESRAGYRDGEAETWAELFERLYGEPLGEAPDA